MEFQVILHIATLVLLTFLTLDISCTRVVFCTRDVFNSWESHAALPKFGEWDESNPSEEEYTMVLNKVRDERHSGSLQFLPITKEHSRRGNHGDDHGVNFGETSKIVGQQSSGSDISIKQSPLHSQAIVADEASEVVSPSGKKGSSECTNILAPSTIRWPQQSSHVGGNETADKDATVSNSGEKRDQENVSSANGCSYISDKGLVNESAKPPVRLPELSSYSINGHREKQIESSWKCCCFPRGLKSMCY